MNRDQGPQDAIEQRMQSRDQHAVTADQRLRAETRNLRPEIGDPKGQEQDAEGW